MALVMTDTPTRAELAAARLERIQEHLAAGRTVYIVSATRAWSLTAKVAARFQAAGVPLLKVGRDGHLLMAQGRRYVSVDGCAIRVEA